MFLHRFQVKLGGRHKKPVRGENRDEDNSTTMDCGTCLKLVGTSEIKKMAQPTDWSVTTFSGLTAYLGFLSSVLSRLKHVELVDTSSRHVYQLLSLFWDNLVPV